MVNLSYQITLFYGKSIGTKYSNGRKEPRKTSIRLLGTNKIIKTGKIMKTNNCLLKND